MTERSEGIEGGFMTRLLVCAPLGIEARAVRRGLCGATVVRTGLGAGPSPSLFRGHDAVAVAGFGGALDEGLGPGEVLVATEVRYGDRRLPCAAAALLARELARTGVPAQTGPLVTAGHLVRGRERGRLARSGARAVDMEAGPLLAAVGGRPAAVVRAIVDTPRRPLLSAATLTGGLAAYRALRCAGPALLAWSAAVRREGGP
jgi:4-hydroxy-3-methylbut-2-en-1-yl diphosphate reductase